ncbi:hypothetical protein K4K94_12500 [Phaeobacter inhibens]|uniref:hypothetical protein n=1 Tax=Phaeobacter inhibens TaxID=221822 RepID=UPI0021A5B79D|nr:hypothetical protein [Phaeobacter inhibens]UWS03120.1 hypothetical protein K4K94_12500 [Phaeobacter inhibens]
MNRDRKPLKILNGPNDILSFEQASHSVHARLDLARHDQSHLEKLGFAIDALNRWNAFVKSVEQIADLIQRYEETTRPLLGGSRDE